MKDNSERESKVKRESASCRSEDSEPVDILLDGESELSDEDERGTSTPRNIDNNTMSNSLS